METVIFLIESPHMKHEHCFAVKVDKKENVRGKSVDSHCVGSEFDGGCDNIDPHMGDEVVGHMVVACFVCIFCIVGAHEIKEQTEGGFRKKCNKMSDFFPKHDKACGGANHCGHDGKGETAGFTMKKIKSCGDEDKAEEIEKSSDFRPKELKV